MLKTPHPSFSGPPPQKKKKSVSWLSPPLFHHRRNKDAFSVKALLGNLSPGAFFFFCFFHSIDDIPLHDHSQSLTCDHHLCSFPASLPLTRKCTSIPFFTTCHQWTSATFPQRSNQQCLDFPCAVLSLLLFCWRVCSVSKRKRNKKKRPYFLLLWLAKDPSPLSGLYISKADSFFVRSYTQGAVIVQIHVHVQYWPFKTTFKTLLVIKKETLYLFSKDKKDSRESHIIIHSINYIVDRTWKYI